jgi:hypothetical protein
MMKKKLLVFILVPALAAGCYKGSRLAGDGSTQDTTQDALTDAVDMTADPVPDPVADVLPDIPAEPELPLPDCVNSYYWELQPRMITTVSHLDFTNSRMGVTERLLVEVQLLSACEFLGAVDVSYTPGDATDFAGLRASAWAPVGLDCPPSAPLVTWIVTIPGRWHNNFRVVVTDENSPGGGLRMEYGREPCQDHPDCQCYIETPAGSAREWSSCITDCSCTSGLSCVGYLGLSGEMWSCVRPCNDFLDCRTTEECLPPIPDSVPNVCSHPADTCETDEDCPAGFECQETEIARYCVDWRNLELSRPCECDEQCPAGQRCVLSYRDVPTCEVPCLRTADCPPHDLEPGFLVCGTPNVCVVLGP